MLDQFEDKKNKGNVNYNDFVKASVNKEKMLTDDNIRKFFNFIDCDLSGSISQTELKSQFGIKDEDNIKNTLIWEDIIKILKLEKDDDISYEQFKELLLNVIEKS